MLANILYLIGGLVGGLVLGDAAVNAGIVSPIVVIVVALTSVTGLLFSDMDIVNAYRWWRFLFIIFSTVMGAIGFIVAGIIFITKLSSIEVLDVPYLSPFSPLYTKSIKESIINIPRNKAKIRPLYLENNDVTRLGDNNEN